ncbi:hypothetical protein BGZ99_008442 [Dissophora globulifera]|uniref:Uncharacterized protein n=1 Tax=Dissophora globulifera TaxID=979702 RepID=A0A9P6UPE1_9FUNG|nr:hypothetical protein BGZ99_008442 [Dissophora globulifera]
MSLNSINSIFDKPRNETYFARFSHSLMLPVSFRDLESLDPIMQAPGQKAGYLFHRGRNGEWSRQYFYIHPRGMLMQFAKGKDIQVANLNQTLLRTINVDQRDFVFEICSIEVYLMESVLQATTKVEFEEWKAALFYWHPPDEDIPQIDTLKIATPLVKPIPPRPRHLSMGRAPDQPLSSPRPRMSAEFPIVIKGDLFVLDLRSKPMNAQNKVGTWKRINCCIRSNGHFAQYNIRENEKPFETIPLADTLRTHIWAIDGSLFSKKHCFSIKTSHDVNYYTVSLKRSSTDQETFNTWLYALKSYAKPEVFGASELLEFRLYRTFWIMVMDGRQLPKDLEAYCEITLDDQRRARTSTRVKAPRGDLAAFGKGITINVIQVKGSKMIPVGRTQIPIRITDDYAEGWYPILHVNDRTKSTEHLGDLRLKLKYEEQIVLPLANYCDVLDIIMDFQENNVISQLAKWVKDLEGFSGNVLRILEGKGLAVVWLNSLIDDEIAETDPTRVNTLFRGNTLLTKALDSYMRLFGTEYLDDTLGDILRTICKNKIGCEVDPSRLDKGDDIKTQWKILMFHTRACWRAVTDSIDQFPKELLLVFSHLQRRLTEKFSDHGPTGEVDPDSELASLARYTGVSGFVFLRLICPAILGPKLFHIVREHPEPRAHRTLTLIAKSLQGLANLVTFGTKEAWMVPMNEFIVENTRGLKEFIDQICLAENTSSEIASSSTSVRSLPFHGGGPPLSPGTSSSSIFRPQTKNGTSSSSNNNNSSSGPASSSSSYGGGGGAGNLCLSTNTSPTPSGTGSMQGQGQGQVLLPSPGSQTQPQMSTIRSSLLRGGNSSSTSKDTVQPPVGEIDPISVERNMQDMPLLPHLIDLGKELALFTTTSARAVQKWMSERKDAGDYSEDGGSISRGGSGGREKNANDPDRSGDLEKNEARRHHPGEEDEEVGSEVEEGEEDIMSKVGRVCLEVIDTIRERVDLSVEVEQEERLRATEAIAANATTTSSSSSSSSAYNLNAASSHYRGGSKAMGAAISTSAAGGTPGTATIGGGMMMLGGIGRSSKVSGEGSRDGDESTYVVYEHYDGQDPDAESFDGYTRGYDSDDDSFGRRSVHDLI